MAKDGKSGGKAVVARVIPKAAKPTTTKASSKKVAKPVVAKPATTKPAAAKPASSKPAANSHSVSAAAASAANEIESFGTASTAKSTKSSPQKPAERKTRTSSEKPAKSAETKPVASSHSVAVATISAVGGASSVGGVAKTDPSKSSKKTAQDKGGKGSSSKAKPAVPSTSPETPTKPRPTQPGRSPVLGPRLDSHKVEDAMKRSRERKAAMSAKNSQTGNHAPVISLPAGDFHRVNPELEDVLMAGHNQTRVEPGVHSNSQALLVDEEARRLTPSSGIAPVSNVKPGMSMKTKISLGIAAAIVVISAFIGLGFFIHNNFPNAEASNPIGKYSKRNKTTSESTPATPSADASQSTDGAVNSSPAPEVATKSDLEGVKSIISDLQKKVESKPKVQETAKEELTGPSEPIIVKSVGTTSVASSCIITLEKKYPKSFIPRTGKTCKDEAKLFAEKFFSDCFATGDDIEVAACAAKLRL